MIPPRFGDPTPLWIMISYKWGLGIGEQGSGRKMGGTHPGVGLMESSDRDWIDGTLGGIVHICKRTFYW
jgi:hypothetical protein